MLQLANLKIANEFDPNDPRFTIQCKSVVSKSHGTAAVDMGLVIFDTGAAMHVTPNRGYASNIIRNTSFSVIGVSGCDKKATCEFIGTIDMAFCGVNLRTGAEVVIKIKGERTRSPNVLI